MIEIFDRKYSMSIEGEVDSCSSYFNEVNVYPRSELKIYDNNNEILNIHNGSSNKIIPINRLTKYMDNKIEPKFFNFKLNKIPSDNIILIKNVRKNETYIPESKKWIRNNELLNLMILILSFFGIYFVYVSYVKQYVEKMGGKVMKGLKM